MIPVSPRFLGKLTTHLSRYSRILSTCFILGTITSQYARAAVTVNFGKADILAIDLAGPYETDGVGTAQQKGDYKARNIDGLFEKRIGSGARYGVYTLEGAYYQYYTGGVKDIAVGYHQRSADYGNVGDINNGTAFLASTAYLIPYTLDGGDFSLYYVTSSFVTKKTYMAQATLKPPSLTLVQTMYWTAITCDLPLIM